MREPSSLTEQLCVRCGLPVEQAGGDGYCARCTAETRVTQPPAASSTPAIAWTLGRAIWLWAFFTLAILILPSIGILVWAGLGRLNMHGPAEAMMNDPQVILVAVSSAFVAHGLTVVVAWSLITQYRRRSFAEAVGWQWHPKFRWYHAAAVVLFFLGLVYGLSQVLPGGETEFDKILEASASVRIVVAILAVVTAPFVEELVYRGVLYPAVAAKYGPAVAVVSVSLLFAIVHFQQYGGSRLILVAITLLSFLLTGIRAFTGRLLPSYAVHLFYNGTVAGLILFSHR